MILSPSFLPWAQGLLAVLVTGLALALVLGVLLLASPRAVFTLNLRLSRWVDTRSVFGMLDRPHNIERFFYRHHRIVGALVVLGAGYVLWRWAFAYDRSGVLALLGRRWLASGLDWIPPALETVVVAMHGAILVIGLVVFFRPSLLKGFEHAANRWQPGPPTTRLDTVVGNVDGAFEAHPRFSGVLLVVAAVWCLTALAPVVLDVLSR